MSYKRIIIDHIKNIGGVKTNRKIVVFSVDDYGNVRLGSKKARENLDRAGIRALSRFDAYDTLETTEDLEVLFETLSSVSDKNNRNVVFTPFTLPCNIDFERMAEENNERYIYELLPQTFSKLETYYPFYYRGAWNLWQEGIAKGLMAPQFHGREHFNVKVFEEKLVTKNAELLQSLYNRSYTNIRETGYSTIGPTSAFEFWDIKENDNFKSIIADGLNAFECVFGIRATNFNAPGAPEHHTLHKTIIECGVKYIDSPWLKNEHQGFNKYKRSFHYTGRLSKTGLVELVRNVVFEPTESYISDWVGRAIRQIDIAFKLNKPAIVSSHRVNFSGLIDKKNRQKGISSLKLLLSSIIQKWPDVEFLSAQELGDYLMKKN